jgi:tetratricopeptide (TPR) repeat protein
MSTALQDKKRKEAAENLHRAEKCLKKTMFQWNPDYLTAAPYIEKAAECFRAAGDLEQAKKIFIKAAEIQNKNKSSFRAAQHTETAAKILQQIIKENRYDGPNKSSQLVEMKKLYEKSSSFYGDMGELGKSAESLMKGASALEESGESGSNIKDMYLRACSLLESQGKPHFAVETFRKTLAYLVKKELYADAVKLLERKVAIFKSIDQDANVHKCYLSEIVLLLTLGDVAAADKAYMQHLQDDEYLKSDECALGEDLLRGFRSGNEELVQTTIKKQGFSFLDNQIGRLARKLSIYGSGKGQSVTATSGVTSIPSFRSAAPNTRNPFEPRAQAASSNLPPAPVVQEYDSETPIESKNAADDDNMGIPDIVEFDFDQLEFADESAETEAAASESITTTAPPPTAPTPAPAPAIEEDMMDLT